MIKLINIEGDFMFKTLIKESNCKNRWYPTPIHAYQSSIKLGSIKETKNFAYSMQHIEYLELQFQELILSEVIYKMNIKSYIITGMGIIEMILTNLLKNSGNWNKTKWKSTKILETNPKKCEGTNVKLICEEFIQVEEYDMRMDLDSMIKKADSKNLLGLHSNDYPALKKLRILRNKVHLQIKDDLEDHDYNSFDKESLQMMRRILYAVLIDSKVQSESGKGKFDFIIQAFQETKKRNEPLYPTSYY